MIGYGIVMGVEEDVAALDPQIGPYTRETPWQP